MKEVRLLIVEDCDDDVLLIKRELTRAGVQLRTQVVSNRVDFEKALTEFKPEVVVCDHSLPQFNSVEALDISKLHAMTTGNPIPFILVTGSVSEEFAAEIIKAGADDYILKDRLKRLPSAIKNALVKRNVENDKIKAQQERQEIFEILQKSLNEIYVFSSDALRFEFVNDGALRNLGYTREEMATLTPLDIQPQLTDSSFAKLLEIVEQNSNQKTVFQTAYLRKDKTTYHAEVHFQSVVHGLRKSILAIVADVTDTKKYIAAIEEQNEKLKEIAWIQSHELRAPLARVMGLVMLVHQHAALDLDDTLERLLASAHELDAVIRKIVNKTQDLKKITRA